MPASPADSSPSSPVKATLPSPWAAVVRGDDYKEPTPPPPASSPSLAAPDPTPLRDPELPPWDDHRDAASDCNVGPGKAGRPAWKALPNGAIEVSAGKDLDGVIGGGSSGVMGDDVAWPALSESTRASSKSLSSDSLASANLSKTPAEGLSSGSQGPVLPNSAHRLATNYSGSPKATEISTISHRRKSSRRNDVGAVSNSSGSWESPSGFSRPQLVSPMPPAFPVFRVPHNGFVNIVPPIMDFLNPEPPYRGSGWDSRPAGVFAHPQMGDAHALSPRGGSFGPRDGNPLHNNYPNRRDQGRRNPPDRRDARLHQQQRGVARGYRGTPPPTLNAPVYMVPQSLRPTFGPPIGFSDIASPYYIPAFPVDMNRSPTYVPPPPTDIMMPMSEIPLSALLVKQIDYYFSDDNLVKDDYLKSNMDNQGWVPMSLICGFPRVRTLTDNVQLILESLGDSSIVEVKDDKIRRRGEWMKWVRFPAHGSLDLGSPSSIIANHNEGSLASSLQNIILEGTFSVDCATEKITRTEYSHPHGESFDQTPPV